MLGGVLIVLLLILLVATWPVWPYSRAWGYVPSGAAAFLLTLVVILIFSGYLAIDGPAASP